MKETWATPSNISCFLNGKVRFWSVHVVLTKIFGSKIRALLFLLFIFIQVEKKIRLRLTEIRGPRSFPGKLLRFQRNRGCPKTVISFEQIIILLESRRLSAERKYFLSILSVNCSGQISFLWIWQPTSPTLTAKFNFCVFSFST